MFLKDLLYDIMEVGLNGYFDGESVVDFLHAQLIIISISDNIGVACKNDISDRGYMCDGCSVFDSV